MTIRKNQKTLRLAASLAALCFAHTTGAQVDAPTSARMIKPAEGLQATLWASEPMVVNPTTLDIDSRGRVWVTEGLNYRLHRNTGRKMERMPDADAIKILDDTDGDGKADKVTIFADKIFPVPMGIAVEEKYDKSGKYLGCRVYVGNSPNLLVLEDTDGDDRADVRYPLLTGFGGIDSDHGVHGMTLGIDGKLYFTHGDGCCSVQPDGTDRVQNFDVTDKSGRKVTTDQLATTLRVNRDGSQFEILADRQRNNYETSQDSFGTLFTSDNDDDGRRGSRVIWIMDGGRYGYRTPGSPRHWGKMCPAMCPNWPAPETAVRAAFLPMKAACLALRMSAACLKLMQVQGRSTGFRSLVTGHHTRLCTMSFWQATTRGFDRLMQPPLMTAAFLWQTGMTPEWADMRFATRQQAAFIW